MVLIVPYLVRTTRPAGYLYRGRIVKGREHATAYDSPSAAARAITRAKAAGIAERLTAVAVKPARKPRT